MVYTRRTVLSLLASTAAIAITPLRPAAAQATSASRKRVALVIGNSAYRNVSALINPRNDATDIAAKLKSLNFDVLVATDAEQAQMVAVLEQFKQKVTPDHVALVFYAGHGVTINRESFLLPVDTPEVVEIDEGGETRTAIASQKLVSMASVLAPLEAAKMGIVFLDACRTNATDPNAGMGLRAVSMAQKTRAVPVVRGAGTSEIKPSPHSAGVFRAYATAIDKVASDGEGRNSPFTRALLKHIGEPITIQELMIKVRKSVREETNGEQVPWEEAALNESFYFVRAGDGGAPSAKGPSGGGGAAAAQKPAARKSNPSLPPNLGVGVGSGL